ncbi:MAG: RNA polymerase sigma factor [Lysobacterales bacterium]
MTLESAAKAVELHRQELTSFAAAMVGADRAEDVVQDACFRLARAMERQPTDQPIKNVRAYLFRITANLARDLLRRDKRSDRHLKTLVDDDHSPAAGDVAALDEQLILLRQAIANLPKKCRRAFVARKYEGLSYREIAAREGITEKTVENHIGRALKLLRESMARSVQ